jgi:hypothetical protein
MADFQRILDVQKVVRDVVPLRQRGVVPSLDVVFVERNFPIGQRQLGWTFG